MKSGIVVGTVVVTRKVESLEGIKLLLVQPVDDTLKPTGEPVVACDPLQSGPGDHVLFETGREAAIVLPNWFNPSDATITAIVDNWHVETEL